MLTNERWITHRCRPVTKGSNTSWSCVKFTKGSDTDMYPLVIPSWRFVQKSQAVHHRHTSVNSFWGCATFSLSCFECNIHHYWSLIIWHQVANHQPLDYKADALASYWTKPKPSTVKSRVLTCVYNMEITVEVTVYKHHISTSLTIWKIQHVCLNKTG